MIEKSFEFWAFSPVFSAEKNIQKQQKKLRKNPLTFRQVQRNLFLFDTGFRQGNDAVEGQDILDQQEVRVSSNKKILHAGIWRCVEKSEKRFSRLTLAFDRGYRVVAWQADIGDTEKGSELEWE